MYCLVRAPNLVSALIKLGTWDARGSGFAVVCLQRGRVVEHEVNRASVRELDQFFELFSVNQIQHQRKGSRMLRLFHYYSTIHLGFILIVLEIRQSPIGEMLKAL